MFKGTMQFCINMENKNKHPYDQIFSRYEQGILYGCGCYF